MEIPRDKKHGKSNYNYNLNNNNNNATYKPLPGHLVQHAQSKYISTTNSTINRYLADFAQIKKKLFIKIENLH
jgi:hypothetical protein